MNMAKINQSLLLQVLRAHPCAGSQLLCQLLGGINRSTLMRALAPLNDQIIALGSARRVRYALRRMLRGSIEALPVYAVNQTGQGELLCKISLVYPTGSALELHQPLPWPTIDQMNDGWFDGLPYPIVDMRPQGFLGRHFAKNHHLALGVADNPDRWTDEDVLHVLSLHGSDQPGNLIIGEPAYRRYLGYLGQNNARLQNEHIADEYPRLATLAMTADVPGSSAGGEFPKFTARRQDANGRVCDVIVKFSGNDQSPAVTRWADLLRCEHLALSVLAESGVHAAAKSRIYAFQGRTFLEIERFDRHGDWGRSPLCTLQSINAALIGQASSNWPRLAQALEKQGWLAASEVYKVSFLWWFGQLIANSDMHEGNLAFQPGLVVAPAYDMLPMLYAPLRGGEIPERRYNPELPLPQEQTVWRHAAEFALLFWQRCLDDAEISVEFKHVCEANVQRLMALGNLTATIV